MAGWRLLSPSSWPKRLRALASATTTPKGISLLWKNGRTSILNPTWLRHNCRCPTCVDSSNGQRILTIQEVAQDSSPIHTAVADDTLIVKWKSEHSSSYSKSFLESYGPRSEAEVKKSSMQLRPVINRLPLKEIDFNAVLASDQALLNWLDILTNDGACLIQGAALDPTAVVSLANRILAVQRTIYGSTFDVMSTEEPINLAYSPVPLELHQDIAYYESPPGLQLLHCVRFDKEVRGGESTLADAFAAAEQLRVQDVAAFESLTLIPATFQKIHYKRSVPVHITYQKPILTVNRHGDVVAVTWSPPFEGPLQRGFSICLYLVAHHSSPEQGVTSDEADAFYAAYIKFAALLDRLTVRLRLVPGQVLTFNNRRMVHGREGFTLPPNTQRHLVGAYVHVDEFRSRHRVLKQALGGGTDSPVRVGNGDME